jgi:hypothetical protein
MPGPDLVQQRAVVFHLPPGTGQHDVYGAQKDIRRTLGVAEDPAHDRHDGNTEVLRQRGFVPGNQTGSQQDLLVSVPGTHAAY